jgi:hypothetical protein
VFIFLGRVDKVPDPEPHGGDIDEDEIADGGLIKDLNEPLKITFMNLLFNTDNRFSFSPCSFLHSRAR